MKIGSKCSFIPYKLRFLAEFCLVLPALMTFFNTRLGREMKAALNKDSVKGNDAAMMNVENLLAELKVKIIEVLNLIDVRPEDIGDDDPLVGGKLDIDSIDVLEMVIMIEKDYGVRIDNRELGVKVFATLRSLAEYIHRYSTEPAA